MSQIDDETFLLGAIEDPGTARIMVEILRQINGEPLMAARMLRAFQSAKAILTETLQELPAKWKQLEDELSKADLHRAAFTNDLREFRESTTNELKLATADLKELQAWAEKIDEDKFINRLNRVLEVCERLAKAKRDGTFDLIKKLL